MEENAKKKRQVEMEKLKAGYKKPTQIVEKSRAVAPSMGTSHNPGMSVQQSIM